MKLPTLALLVTLCLVPAVSMVAQSPAADADHPAAAALAQRPWEYGPFFQGGTGVGDRSDFHFAAAGFRLGKVLTPQFGRGLFRGQFEYAGEIMPYWQAFTPAQHLQAETAYDPTSGLNYTYYLLTGGGTFTGASLTPVIFRWDFKPGRRFAPWFQGAGGLIYTTHKFPPDILVQHGQPGGTSVWNFSPQGGIGVHYFIRPGRAITLSANGVHISSASLGDKNPGVNASVQFQIGYTFFGKRF
ncbi:MAG TPA: acyloxyacyl hydrolase [Acidobacteriaceae bacterium]|nr:acyloxyacyl hydrolase [Acidobacteriaceae bacterium]